MSESQMPRKTFRIRATVEYEVSLPGVWDKAGVEFHRNEGTYCADSMLDELEEYRHTERKSLRPGCLCGDVHFEVLSVVEEEA